MSDVPAFSLILHDLSHLSPNTLGELLRDLLFDQKGGEEVGCYTTFEVRSGWREWEQEEVAKFVKWTLRSTAEEHEWEQSDWDDREFWWNEATGYVKWFGDEPVMAAWFWDGDGSLIFQVGNRLIVNHDCKKNYEWEDASV